ncbi:C39 family peptidase, partial [Clostridium sp.]
DKSNDDKYLKEGISLLEISKEINLYDPMVTWNLSYMHELLDEDEKALDYGQEVLERERFYPEAYIKQHDYLMNLYSKTGDEKYETKVKELEEYYYKNYNELNKRAKYMNNQLQENYDDIRSENLDYNILLNGKYEKKMKYFNQEDEKWARFPYKTVNNPLSKTGCGVTAMAMIQATMNELEVTPIDMAKYSIEKDYCNNDTSIEFFDEVAKDERYKLNLEKFDGNEITKVKRLLSDGKHIAVALMRPGDFTTEGHYIVLYGIETINGINYFNALDSNKDNNNYSDSGNIIYNKPKDGFIKVKSSLFLEQCIQFWVYSI